jgi:uncharacterized protein (DUF4415 family)
MAAVGAKDEFAVAFYGAVPGAPAAILRLLHRPSGRPGGQPSPRCSTTPTAGVRASEGAFLVDLMPDRVVPILCDIEEKEYANSAHFTACWALLRREREGKALRNTKPAEAPPKTPPLPGAKEMVSLRIDRDVLDFFQEDGPGWQERINAALRKAAGK